MELLTLRWTDLHLLMKSWSQHATDGINISSWNVNAVLLCSGKKKLPVLFLSSNGIHADSFALICPGFKISGWDFCLHPNLMEMNSVFNFGARSTETKQLTFLLPQSLITPAFQMWTQLISMDTPRSADTLDRREVKWRKLVTTATTAY